MFLTLVLPGEYGRQHQATEVAALDDKRACRQACARLPYEHRTAAVWRGLNLPMRQDCGFR